MSRHNELPDAIEPFYPMRRVNEEVQLYAGRLRISSGQTVLFEGMGWIRLEWLPAPSIQFYIVRSDDTAHALLTWDQENFEMHLLDIPDAQPVRAIVFGVSPKWEEEHGWESRIEGVCEVEGQYNPITSEQAKCVVFHVPNFFPIRGSPIRQGSMSHRARVVLRIGQRWRVTLDGLPDSEERKNLNRRGGFLFTLSGKLERADNKLFRLRDAQDVLDATSLFLSFARGLRTSCVLPVGFDKRGKRVWEGWKNWSIESWNDRAVYSWFIREEPGSLCEAISGFYEKWRDRRWAEVVKLAVGFYLQANNKSGGIDGAVIFACAGLELLANSIVMEDRKIIRDAAKIRTGDKIRVLLQIASIPLPVPVALRELHSYCKGENHLDGPGVVTNLRNWLLHSDLKNRGKYDALFAKREAIYQAHSLAVWYLELMLLFTFDYKGEYFNRTKDARSRSEASDQVPWHRPA